MKTVNYHGNEIKVDDWVKSIANDSDGRTYAYSIDAKIVSMEGREAFEFGSNDTRNGDRYRCFEIYPSIEIDCKWIDSKVVFK